MSADAVIPMRPANRTDSAPSTEGPAQKPSFLKTNSPSEDFKGIIAKHWRALEASHKPDAWGALDRGYSDPRRAYHGWGHIAELLGELDAFQALAVKPELIATAVFWHDAVYATRAPGGAKRSDFENVRDSAELFLRHTLLNAKDAAAVRELIMATADHTRAEASDRHYQGFAGDLDLFLDLDLSPLAAPWKTFAANLENIRFEFAWVPEREFYLGQIGVLEGFLNAGGRLFRRAETSSRWLAPAKANLQHCIGELRARLD
jgi:predicted metal-dependent HD superfamily phosphohydrolase